MECRYCHITIIDNAIYCHICGRKQIQNTKRRRHRAQSQGTITKLSGRRDNPYWARLPADYTSGQPIRKSLGCYPTYAAAAEALNKAIYLIETATSTTQVITLRTIYNRFAASHYYLALSRSAQSSHRTAWSHLSSCADTPIASINKTTFQVVIDTSWEQGLKRESLAKIRNLASLLCQEAMGMGLLTVNYGRLVQLPRADTTSAKPFTSEDLQIMWKAVDAGNKDAMAVQILNYTGMRPSELLAVDITKHLHMEGDYWYIQIGSKTSAGYNRIIPIPYILHSAVTTLVAGRTSGPLIATKHGGHWRLDNWRPRCFVPLLDQLGLVGYTPYSCRHTYADLQKRRQVAPEIMMTIMGHTDYSTTVEHYHTTTDEDIARICAAADGLTRP